MAKKTKISHPIIESYVMEFANDNEFSKNSIKDQHSLFEKYVNNLILQFYGNDPYAVFEDMETGTAFGIDGIAIFIADKMVTNIEDVDFVTESLKKFDVSFYFIQSKTTGQFDRQDISDFFAGIRRFFNYQECEIPELKVFWELKNYIYSKGSKFKEAPELIMKYVTLSSQKLNSDDAHMNSTVEMARSDLEDLNLFSKIDKPDFIGIREIMQIQNKLTSGREVSVRMDKQPVPYPKDISKRIKNGYYGLIKLNEFTKLLADEIDGKKILKKGIFNDNIRYYLGSSEKVEVNQDMKNQLLGNNSYLFGLLNNGVTIISDEINLNAEELTLVNYQIVNGCQTSNVIFECIESVSNEDEIYIPIRLIATEDESTKNEIIKATNNQTPLKPEQLAALLPIQKAIEQYYNTKIKSNKFALHYERRTEQYRDESIQKAKIVTIPFQIKASSALFFDLPHEVSGQYGKVEKQTRGLLFKEEDIRFLNSYYISGLCWYKVERFVQNNTVGKNYRRARWHIIMLLKYLTCPIDKNITGDIDKHSEKNSKLMEKVLLDDSKTSELLEGIINIIEECFSKEELEDRKTFEKKETTQRLVKHMEGVGL